MKRIALALIIITGFLVGLFVQPSEAKTRKYTWYLTAADITTATAPSGTSTMVVGGNRYSRGRNQSTLSVGDTQGVFTMQINDITGVTVSAAENDKGGDPSGTTWVVRVKFSLLDDSDMWSGASYYDVMHSALSGNSLYAVNLNDKIDDLPLAEFMRVEWVSGITSIGKAEVLLMVTE